MTGKHVMTKWMFAAALLVATSLSANAQQTSEQYAYLPGVAPTPAQTAPADWSYNPYTNGMGPCAQRSTGPRCNEIMPPSYGQPNSR